jgi:hypothetical protein
MFSRAPESRVIVFTGLILLLVTTVSLFAGVRSSAVLAGVTPTQESPVDTPTSVPPTDTPVYPTRPPWPTKTPRWPQYPTPTPVPIVEVFVPAPTTGGRPVLGVPIILWEAGLGLVLVGVGLAWRRAR